jgi:hypothetical protein
MSSMFPEDRDVVVVGQQRDGGFLVRHLVQKQIAVHDELQVAAGREGRGQKLPRGVAQQEKMRHGAAEQLPYPALFQVGFQQLLVLDGLQYDPSDL